MVDLSTVLGLKAPLESIRSLNPQTKCSIQTLEFLLFEPSSESSAAFVGEADREGTQAL